MVNESEKNYDYGGKSTLCDKGGNSQYLAVKLALPPKSLTIMKSQIDLTSKHEFNSWPNFIMHLSFIHHKNFINRLLHRYAFNHIDRNQATATSVPSDLDLHCLLFEIT